MGFASLPDHLVTWWRSLLPCRRGRGFLLVLVSPATPVVLSGPGYVAGAEQGCSLSRRHCRPPFPSSAGRGSVLTPQGILEVALLGSLSWKCSPLITDYEQPFPCFEARCKCLLSLEAFRSLRPSVPLSCVFSSP